MKQKEYKYFFCKTFVEIYQTLSQVFIYRIFTEFYRILPKIKIYKSNINILK